MSSVLRPGSGLFLALALVAAGCDAAGGGRAAARHDDARNARQSG